MRRRGRDRARIHDSLIRVHAILPMDGPLPESPRFAEGLGRPAAVHVWRRGMPLDMQALSKLVIWTVRGGIRARRVVEAARRREA